VFLAVLKFVSQLLRYLVDMSQAYENNEELKPKMQREISEDISPLPIDKV